MKNQCFHLWLIRFIGLIVPRRLRTDWRQEWEAELLWREHQLAQWDRLDWQNKFELLRRSLGALTDALCLQPRRLEDEMFQDLRFGLRMMFKHKLLTLAVTVSLALGIGANAAIFSLTDAVLLKMLPVRQPEQLVLFRWLSGPKRMAASIDGSSGTDEATGLETSTSFSYAGFSRMRAQNQLLTEVFAFAPLQQLNVGVDGYAAISSGQLVSGNYFAGLGVPALRGRTITDADDRANASPVAVISHRYWQRRFGGDPAVIGKSVKVNNVLFTIIGVTPPEFYGTLQIGDAPEVSVAMAMERQLVRGDSSLDRPWLWWLQIMGRLKPGQNVEQAKASLEGVFQQSALEGWNAVPSDRRDPGEQGARDVPKLTFDAGSRGLTDARKQYVQPLAILSVIVGLVLLIACANVANLLVARATARQKEFAVRLALGASRLRMVRQLLTESILLALLGGAGGLLFAWWTKDLLLAWHPWRAEGLDISLNLDGRVFGFTLAMSLLTGLLFGLAPALRATRGEVNATLKQTAGSLKPSGSRLSQSLVVAQIAISLLLLIGAGLFLRTLRNLQSVDLGFNTENVLLFRVDPRLNDYQGDQIAALYERMIERLATLPGVRSATLSRHPLLSGSSARDGFSAQGRVPPAGEDNNVYVQRIRWNFFETMELPLRLGRQLTAQDDSRAPKVAVINQALARKYFPDANPVGKRFGFGGPKNSGEIEIVGVVADAKYAELRQDDPLTVYLPYPQESLTQMNFAARSTGDPLALIAAVREAVRQVDQDLPLFDVKTQSKQAAESLALERLFARLTGLLGLLAVALAGIGLYGVMSYTVASRTHEIGLRMALGAQAGEVLRMVLRQTLLLVVTGLVIGLAAAFATTKLMESLLFGLTATDPLTMATAAAVMLAVAAVAGWLPARRAAQVDPMVALRHE
jgi:predicted permease